MKETVATTDSNCSVLLWFVCIVMLQSISWEFAGPYVWLNISSFQKLRSSDFKTPLPEHPGRKKKSSSCSHFKTLLTLAGSNLAPQFRGMRPTLLVESVGTHTSGSVTRDQPFCGLVWTMSTAHSSTLSALTHSFRRITNDASSQKKPSCSQIEDWLKTKFKRTWPVNCC